MVAFVSYFQDANLAKLACGWLAPRLHHKIGKKPPSLELQVNVIFLIEKVATYDTSEVNQSEGLVRVKGAKSWRQSYIVTHATTFSICTSNVWQISKILKVSINGKI
jgi:hypothetical protein